MDNRVGIAAMLLWLQADASVGAVGWGAVAYSGLLSAVLAAVFFKVIPDKDRAIASLVEAKDKLTRELVAAKDVELRETRADYRSSLAQVLAACEKEHAELAVMVREQAKGQGELSQMVRDVLTELRNRGKARP